MSPFKTDAIWVNIKAIANDADWCNAHQIMSEFQILSSSLQDI